MNEFTVPPHYFAGVMGHDFAAIVSQEAKKNDRTFTDELVALAIIGADCQRTHLSREQHTRRRRK